MAATAAIRALLLLVCTCAFAQESWQTLGDATGTRPIAGGVEVSAGRAKLRITALGENVVRVHYAFNGEFPQRHSFGIIASREPQVTPVKTSETADSIAINTGSIVVEVHKSPLRIAFRDAGSRVVAEDVSNGAVASNGQAFRICKAMPADEHYFGLGEKAGPLDHRDQAFTNWNTDAYAWRTGTDPLYKSIPFFVALRDGAAYGLYLDNTFRSNFDFGKGAPGRYCMGADGGDLDYYLFYGPDPKQVLERYTAFTGRMPLPPLFALGYQQSRYSYETEERAREVARQLRAHRIPSDVIYLDIDYEDGHRSFTVDQHAFPNFGGMLHDLRADGFNVVTIIDLHLKQEPGYAPYDQGLKGDHFVHNPDGSLYAGRVWPGQSVFPDFTRDSTRQWWGTLFGNFMNLGVRGIWNDMNEPAVFDVPGKTMPLDTVHRVQTSGDDRKADHREIHNVFGSENARATYEGLLRLQPDVRPFVLTRASFTGGWRYAATWTGDNSSTWEHLRLSVPELLNLGVSGFAFVGADVGGFAGSPTPELLTRWIELGAFYPLFRNHTEKATRDQEPWVHGPEHEAIRRRYVELRYRLLPYIYTAMEETSRTGIPAMRPLFLEYPAGDLVANDTEFLFGRDLLVAPKLTETLDPYPLRLPPGEWYGFWTGKRVQPGKRLMLDPQLGEMPIYVRGGAIIPEQPLVQHTGQIPDGPLRLTVYPGVDCKGSLYADDGNSLAYRHGQFYRAEFTCDASSSALTLRATVQSAAFTPWFHQAEIVVLGAPHRPTAVTLDGTPLSNWAFDETRDAVSITLPLEQLTRPVVIKY